MTANAGARRTGTGHLYVYAIVDRTDAALPEERGIGGYPVGALSYRDIAAVVSPIDEGRAPAASRAAVRHHERIVEALMVGSTVLPVRFGTHVIDEVTARDLLAARYSAFVETLRRVRGRVELGLRVLWPGDAGRDTPRGDRAVGSDPLSSGTRYLQARLEEEQRARAVRIRGEALAQGIHRPLAAIAFDSARETLPTPRTLLTAAYLVDRGRTERVRQEVAALARDFASLRFLLTGPWPPYHFCAGAPNGEIGPQGGRGRGP